MSTKKQEPIIAYKGFDKNLQCRGFQFAVGKTYEHQGSVHACSSGFHACENPLDVWSYYSPTDSRFCIVELSGELSRHEGDTKIAAGKITVKAEIGIPQIVTKAIEWVMSMVKDASDNATASGDSSKQAASGDSSKQAASGDSSKQAASGNYSTQAASGNSSTQAASGDSSKQAASGNSSTQAASGDYSKQAASGNSSTQAASGNYSTQAASGNSSTQAASGNSSTQAASGDYSKHEITGQNGVIVSAGAGAKAKASGGGCFALRWDDNERPRIAVAYVGENGIKPDTWYELDAKGAFVEVA